MAKSPIPKSLKIHEFKQMAMSIYPFSEEEWVEFERLWFSYSAKRKSIITEKQETERYLYFVLDGIQRIFYVDDQGRQATLVFTYSKSFGGIIDSFFLQQPSAYIYETVSHSEFLRVRYEDIQLLIKHFPNIALFIQKGLTFALSGLLERLAEQQCFSSEEKFRSLLQRSPHILNLVPHKYLASYLGINPTNFSKLMNKVLF